MGKIDWSERRHNIMVEKIFQKPYLIDVDSSRIENKVMEFVILMNGRYYVVPDIKFYMNDGMNYFCEIKSSKSDVTMMNGKRQMERILNYSTRNKINATGLLIYPKRNYRWIKDSLDNLVVEQVFRKVYK